MDLKEFATWKMNESSELFYNEIDCTFFVRQDGQIFRYFEYIWTPVLTLQDNKTVRYKNACISQDNTIFVYQVAQNEINIVSGKDTFVLKAGKNKVIISFVLFREKSLIADLAVIMDGAVDFYKIYDKPVKASVVKGYSVAVSEFWVDYSQGVMVTARVGSLELMPYFLYQTKGYKYFQGSSFAISDKTYIECGFCASLHNSNLASCQIVPLDKLQVIVSKLYDFTCILVLDGLLGCLKVFKLEQETQSFLFMTISLKPGGYSLRVFDNLIVFHNYGPQESYIYDIKKDTDPEKCMIQVKHRGSSNNEHTTFQVYYPSEIDPHFVPIGKYFYLDTVQGRLFELSISNEALIEDYPDKIEAILYLLRRDRCLQLALSVLNKSLDEKISPSHLNHFFNLTNSVYKETAMMRKYKKKEESHKKEEPASPRKSENQLKSISGMTILLQSDMFVHVFKKYYKENKDYLYLSKVITTYVYSLIGQDLHVHESHQFLLIKTLLKLKSYKLIQSYMQYHMIGNTMDIAYLLTALNNKQAKHPEIFNLGIDMMFKLKKFESIVKVLAEKGDIYEALSFFTMYEANYDIDHLKRCVAGGDYESLLLETLEELEHKGRV